MAPDDQPGAMTTLDPGAVKKTLASADRWASRPDRDSPAERRYRRELFAFFKELALDYCSASPGRRKEIRALFEATPVLVENLPVIGEAIADEARCPADTDAIRAAAALFSICDMRCDSRDAQISLLETLRIAQRAGIDPAPLVRDVAAISRMDDGEYSAKAFLEKFV